MPFLVIPFPAFDPIAIAIGPIAIRWYALGYIFGIVLGWIYARALIKRPQLWNGASPITLLDMDDFILWVTVGIILGGRTGYVLFYNLPFFIQHPGEILELWKGGMSFHGGFLGCVAAVMLFCWKRNLPTLSLGDITCGVAPIGIFLVRLTNFIEVRVIAELLHCVACGGRASLGCAPENGIAECPGDEVWRFVRAGTANHKLQDSGCVGSLGRGGHQDH